jgi:hypothetical protein
MRFISNKQYTIASIFAPMYATRTSKQQDAMRLRIAQILMPQLTLADILCSKDWQRGKSLFHRTKISRSRKFGSGKEEKGNFGCASSNPSDCNDI